MLSEPAPRIEFAPPVKKVTKKREWRFVCLLEDLRVGGMRPFKVRGRSILLARRPDGEVRAVANTCPHEAARMSDGKLEKMWHGDGVGDQYQNGRCVVVCPWHNFEFDLETGKSTCEPERMRLKTYPVEVIEGEVLVRI